MTPERVFMREADVVITDREVRFGARVVSPSVLRSAFVQSERLPWRRRFATSAAVVAILAAYYILAARSTAGVVALVIAAGLAVRAATLPGAEHRVDVLFADGTTLTVRSTTDRAAADRVVGAVIGVVAASTR